MPLSLKAHPKEEIVLILDGVVVATLRAKIVHRKGGRDIRIAIDAPKNVDIKRRDRVDQLG